MNRRQKSKLDFFLGGFEETYENGKDYFIGISLSFISGRKEYSGAVKAADGKFVLSFAGDKEFSSFSELSAEISETALKYDAAKIEDKERGITTILEADDRNVKLSKKETRDLVAAPQLKEKSYNINLHKAKDLLFALGYTTEDGKLKNDKIRKYNQTDRFVELVKPLFTDEKKLTIVDCACGKSYLSFSTIGSGRKRE